MINTHVKRANLGGEPSADFERSFAELAYAYLQDKAPALLDLMVGFQLVDRNEDNTKAAAIFGFRIGGQWAYAPVFFINGELKGHELLYLKGQNRFVPLKENWVNYLLNRRPPSLGEGVDKTKARQGIHQPDYYDLAYPPQSGKSASVKPRPPVHRWAQESGALKDYAKWCFDKEAAAWLDTLIRKDPLPPYLKTATDLKSVLEQDIRLLKAARAMCQKWPGVKAAMRKHYGDDLLLKVAQQVKQAQESCDKGRGKSHVLKPYKPPAEKTDVLGRPLSQKEAAPTGVVVIRYERTLAGGALPLVSGDEKESLIRDGYLIRDERKDSDDVSQAYQTSGPLELSNPTETGVYDVLVKPGQYEKLLVLCGPWSDQGRGDKAAVIRLSGEKNWQTTHSTNIFTKQTGVDSTSNSTRQDFLDAVKDAPSTSPGSLQSGSVYVILSDCGDGTFPFEVLESHGDGCYDVRFYDYGPGRPDYLPSAQVRHPFSPDTGAGYGSHPLLQFNQRQGTSFRLTSDKLYVPQEVKVIKLQGSECDCDDCCGCPANSRTRPIAFGNLADVEAEVMQKTAELRVRQDGPYVRLNNREFYPDGAIISLVTGWGLREKAAREILQQAAVTPRSEQVYRVKLASPYLTDEESRFMPGFPEPMPAAQGGFGNTPAFGPSEETYSAPAPPAREQEEELDPMLMQMAQEAEGSGQKELFDTSVIGGLLKSMRGSVVDRNLPPLMTALDRIGRIMFSFWWHNEEFADRYGKQDIPELEDTLRNTFEALGDLVLYLKRKTVDPRGAAGELGEPSIEEAAYN